ncbi:tRNA (adenosine(37)-N6)-threonylcarbamoyltransferase complex ATPase subunit type 1 TsaE [Halobacillus litoralis]|uniref:tRNA threonylcarbamoyladenosine biosynthesis protein TsaE n=1 Tax=Halobacillus litoralis TaxID=45668 RepID=A0A845DX52_9BACI|nr:MULTISPECIES: tRNA (adenosine(37)-N6)-threonylcarbamoyltransferase complex ATPase subunit type 1 TsaE [Halobacillus]MCA1024257.1 tRNA (adenosine(37)-N6)-threonylcarbamoyltransferase complex ATPase subunit type 1 TsaE [Halobacillus litoralis]MYL21668.1 tRNA (adenosine(37)-N6)-threonylcarbamoyltransferase complex ATPase subunit type 1 TsaE [Halobacillus litoralis]MYL29834.1 tRNA (adenosine(37)-N6)-threonylcarbamoyltransferase complex ATPase subunit type 1 TsaE [Halobacillus halophilus]MYL37640
MTAFEWRSSSVEETNDMAVRLGEKLTAGDVLTLEGDLGAGKTTFTKGLGKGLGVRRTINSPTFTIIKEYQGRVPFYHMDVYRLEDSDEDLGFDEYFDGHGVTVVEWAQFIEEYLPQERLDITIRYLDDTVRVFHFETASPRLEQVCKEILS